MTIIRTGDISAEHGTNWINLDDYDWGNGYVDVIRTGEWPEEGHTLVEHITVLIDGPKIRDALKCCGYDSGTFRDYTREQKRAIITEALMAYGHYDPANDFPDHHCEVLHTDSFYPRSENADKSVHAEDLEGYVNAKWLTRL